MTMKIKKSSVNIVIIVVVGLIILGYGLYQSFNARAEMKEEKIQEATTPSSPAAEILEDTETIDETEDIADETADETEEEEGPPPTTQDVGRILFYIFLNDEALTGAKCQAIGEQYHSTYTEGGIAEITTKTGVYDIVVTYQSFSHIEEITLHDYGKRIEVFWTSTVEPDTGTLIVEAYSDNNPISPFVEVYQDGELIAEGTGGVDYEVEFDLVVGDYRVYCYYLDFYEGYQDAEIIENQITYRTFSWVADGNVPLSWLSDMTDTGRTFIMANLFVVLGILIVVVALKKR